MTPLNLMALITAVISTLTINMSSAASDKKPGAGKKPEATRSAASTKKPDAPPKDPSPGSRPVPDSETAPDADWEEAPAPPADDN